MSKRGLSKLTVEDYFKIVAVSTGILMIVYAVIFGCGSGLISLLSVGCGNEVLEEAYSPDGQYKAVVFQSDCGATTRLHIHISLLKADQELSNLSRGNLFSSQEVVDIEAIWKNNRSIQIIYSSAVEPPIAKEQFQYGNHVFEIEYRAKVKE